MRDGQDVAGASEKDVCPGDWKVKGYVRSSHSMFHPAMHECVRDRWHHGRCRCSCGREKDVFPRVVRSAFDGGDW